MYDIIGDIHGQARRLEALLHKLGYRPLDGVWRHPRRKALLLGDIIDRGPEQLETVLMVKRMVEADAAQCILGNHEFNAVSFTLPDPARPGDFLRAHSPGNRHQHQTFLDQVGEGSALHQELLDWFKTLPLYLDLEGLRAVHACWDPASLAVIHDYLTTHGGLRDDAWLPANQAGNPAREATTTLLKGFEVPLPAGMSFIDKKGITRHAMRTRWWDLDVKTYRELGYQTEDARHHLPDVPVDTRILPGYDNRKPVFFGHYWLTGTPQPLAPAVACLDYSGVRPPANGRLCAYRWDGESVLHRTKFHWV